MTEQATVAGSRPCAYCSQPFTPKSDEQLYCKPTHQVKAARKRRRGTDPVTAPLTAARCAWCGSSFKTGNRDQRYCCALHREHAKACDRKEDFLAEDAAAAAASRRVVPGLPGLIGYYQCPRPGGAPHWHLRKDRQVLESLTRAS
jgi:hypothetical protein